MLSLPLSRKQPSFEGSVVVSSVDGVGSYVVCLPPRWWFAHRVNFQLVGSIAPQGWRRCRAMKRPSRPAKENCSLYKNDFLLFRTNSRAAANGRMSTTFICGTLWIHVCICVDGVEGMERRLIQSRWHRRRASNAVEQQQPTSRVSRATMLCVRTTRAHEATQ